MKISNKINTRRIINWSIFILILTSIMVIFAILDFDISQDVVNSGIRSKTAGYREITSTFGYSAFVLPVFFTLTVLIQKILVLKKNNYRYVYYWTLTFLLLTLMIFLSVVEAVTREFKEPLTNYEYGTIIATSSVYITTMLYYQIWFWIYKRNDVPFINKMFINGIKAFVYLLVLYVIVTIMKQSFGRNRPIDVFKKGYEFYYPFEINFSNIRGVSFPSAHTATTMSLLALSIIFASKSGIKKWILNTLIFSLVLIVGISRILNLSHFCSDVVMSIEIGSITYILCIRMKLTKIINYKKQPVELNKYYSKLRS